MTYRIRPTFSDGWTVQKLWFGLIWYDILQMVGYDAYEALWFRTEREAEAWAQAALQRKIDSKLQRKRDRERTKSVRPRVIAAATPAPQAEPGAGTIRVCPERDGKCPHGMSCPYTIDRYHCDIAASRAALSPEKP